MPDSNTHIADKDTKQAETKSAPVIKKPRKKSWFRRLLKYMVFLLIAGFSLFIFLFLFVQTEQFNNWLLDYTFNKLNESWGKKDGKIYAESLRGNIFTGIRLYNGNITMKGDTLVKFSNLQVRYNLLALVNKEIVFRMILNDPQVNLTKVNEKEGKPMWNLVYLFQSEEKEVDTVKKPFEWGVKTDELKINNGRIRLLAQKPQGVPIRDVKMKNIDTFDPDYFDITNLQVDLDVKYYPELKNIRMKHLSFNTNSEFSLKDLSLDATVNESDTATEVRNLDLTTGKTHLTADTIAMVHLDPFAGVDYARFKNNETKLVLHSDKFNFEDLKFFIPQVSFMDGTLSFDMNAHGNYSKLAVDKLIIHTPNSYLNLTGRVDNLSDPDRLNFDISGRNLQLDAADTKIYLPGLQIPDYSHVGKVNADIRYTGEPTNFKTEFDVRTAYGNANGTFALNLNTPQYTYDAKVETSNLDVGAITKNEELKSSINTRAEINGSGFDVNTASAKVSYDLVNSKIYNQNIVKSAGTIEIHSRELSADLTLASDKIQTTLKGRVNLANTSDAEYSMKGSVHDLDVSEFTKRASDKSDLNFSFDVNGRGTTLDNIEGTYDLNFGKSFYASYNIPPSPLMVKVDNIGSNRSLSLNSDFFDFKAKGKFNPENIAEVLNENLRTVTAEVRNKFSLDSISSSGSISNVKTGYPDMNVQYEFTAKNILPLTKMFDSTGFDFKGDITGNITNSTRIFSVNADFDINNFSFTDTSFAAKVLKGNIDFKNDYSKEFIPGDGVLYPVYTDINLTSRKLKSGGFNIDTLDVALTLQNGDQTFHLYGRRDTTYAVNLTGGSSWGNNLVDLSFDSLILSYRQKDFRNKGKVSITYNPDPIEKTFTFNQLELANSMLNLSATGDFSIADSSNLDIEAKQIKIGQLTDLLYPGYADYTDIEKQYFKSPIRGNIRRLSVMLRGNASNPVVSLEMNTDLIRYERTRIGRVDAFIDYANSTLSPDILISNATGKGRLRLTGDVPMANPFVPASNENATISQNPVNLKLNAKNFQLSFFSSLLPRLGDVRGLLNGEINTRGTVDKPALTGEMDITNGRFLLGITGLYHRFNAKFRTDNSNLIVDDLRIMNVEDNGRHIDFWGNINFEGLKLNNIDLTGSGDLVVLDQSAQDNDLGLYGDMIVGVGEPPVTLKGDSKSISLTGQFLIKSANVKVASIPTSAYDLSSDNFVYRTLKDTIGTEFIDTVIQVSPKEFARIDPFLKSNVVASSKPVPSSFNIYYNLDVRTVKDANVSIIFNDITKEELYGQIKAELNVTNNYTGQMQVYGNLDVTGDSYYRFYRNFKVKDSRLVFTGPPSNPELNIHAVYENKPSTEAIGGTIASDVVQIVLEIHGTKDKPKLTLKLYQGGNEVTGSDAQSDAISYLLFGVSKNDLVSGQRTNLAKNVGATTSSAYLSSLFGNAMRDIAPFVTNAEVNYSEGSVATGTDIRITSEVGDATVRFGGKIFSGLGNAEVVIEYPLDRLLNINVSNNLVLEASRIIDESSLNGGRSVHTGARLIYKLRY